MFHNHIAQLAILLFHILLNTKHTKNYLIQILLAITWRCWQAEINSNMRKTVQGRLMQARFIEINQVAAKKNKVGYFSNIVVGLHY